MQDHLTKIPGKFDEMDIKCPKCQSKEITIEEDSKGYFKVTSCKKCGFSEKID